MTDGEEFSVQRRTIPFRKLGNQRVFSRRSLEAYARANLPPGAMELKVEFIPRNDGEVLVAQISTLMLAEVAGDMESATITTTFAYSYPVRPWWLPQWLWRRIDWRDKYVTRRLTADVKPVWKYPEATLVPELGRGYRGIEVYQHDAIDLT